MNWKQAFIVGMFGGIGVAVGTALSSYGMKKLGL